jgi:hypothetical protein
MISTFIGALQVVSEQIFFTRNKNVTD